MSVGLESDSNKGFNAFVTGAATAVGSEIIREFLDNGCRVTAFDDRPLQLSGIDAERFSRLHIVDGNACDEEAIKAGLAAAEDRFGPVKSLIVVPACEGKAQIYPIWDLPSDEWEKSYRSNARGAFLAIKHYLRYLQSNRLEKYSPLSLSDPAIVVVETEPGVGVTAGQAGIHRGLLAKVQQDLLRLNGQGRINVVTSGSMGETPADFARTVLLLASSHTSGHVSGQYVQPASNSKSLVPIQEPETTQITRSAGSVPRPLASPKRNKIRVAVSIDLDAVSGWLGTNSHPDNNLADYSSGFFAARVGVPRLLRMLKKLDIANRCTWFIPGHSAESFPAEVQQVVASGAEVGLHGYAHEGAYQLTPQQERDVLEKCFSIMEKLVGKPPRGYRAPLYQLRETTLDLLEEFGFEYDASLTDHDCQPFWAPKRPPLEAIDFSKPAASWMHPIKETCSPPDRRPLVCVPCNYYMEDMTPMQFLPHCENSQGYVDVRVIENMWRDRFLWIRDNEEEPVFPVLMHPDTSGMAHIIGMLERFLRWVKEFEREGEVEFSQTAEIARWFREKQLDKPSGV
ncbi:xylanase/chitin deacetylase [Penicillium chermesinum]|uniref:Xylanase/chitin deacetylase n=1 Tax=Penicillium chermesinum TaxID=63820 RepID=A0A9W9NUS7_9EURO|nr:xylanase/chitin deacetylase [Penicillium chermesinum]KAJ5226393.1 xylanase/chitin deacetylase [Penicillium chermesinum]